MNALDDRRQRAREAYYNRVNLPESHEPTALAEAIETATRVRITPQIVEAMRTAVDQWVWREDTEELARAAFRAAGFEIEE